MAIAVFSKTGKRERARGTKQRIRNQVSGRAKGSSFSFVHIFHFPLLVHVPRSPFPGLVTPTYYECRSDNYYLFDASGRLICL